MKAANIRIKIERNPSQIATGYRISSMAGAVVVDGKASGTELRVCQHIEESEVQSLIDRGFNVTVAG